MKIGFVQINNSFSGQSYLPYSVGLIQAHLDANSKFNKDFDFALPIYWRIKVDDAVERLMDRDVVFFSLYVWNVRISLEIAEKLKRKNPNVKIVCGGPQVPDRCEEFVKKNDFIDFIVHGEGEVAALNLIDSGFDRTSLGISYLSDGNVISIPKAPKIKDVNIIPSPYLAGAFDELMKANPNQEWIACWETNRGCPFSCAFCDWGSSTQSKVSQFGMDRIYKEVDWFSNHQIDFVFCCDANFGMLPRDLDIANYIAEVKVKTNFPKSLSVQNTKNATERAYLVQKKLSDFGLNKGVTLSMQSVDKTTLEYIKRSNISTETYQELQRRFTRDKVETYTDLILGLPGETYDSFTDGIETVINNGQHNRIQFNNCSILPNAEMGNPEYIKKYGLITSQCHIINIHGSLKDSENEVLEMQELIIATDSTPKADWIRTRAHCWHVGFLYFDKIFQIPIAVAHKTTGVGYKEIFTAFARENLEKYPTLSFIRNYFTAKAYNIQNGGEEYCHSEKFLDIFWPADELVLIELIHNNQIDLFYQEAICLLKEILGHDYLSVYPIIHEAGELNKILLKRPFQTEDTTFTGKYNIWEFYQGILRGEEIPVEEKEIVYNIDRTTLKYDNWDDYCREVIWYGNKKGAYLYTNNIMPDKQIAGLYR